MIAGGNAQPDKKSAKAYRAGDCHRAHAIWASLAEAGNRSAQFHLGALYVEGLGIPFDFTQPIFWLIPAVNSSRQYRPLSE